MSLSDNARRLCWHGVLLFLLGLATGALIPAFTNPRMGLSAHLAGTQNGMVLILLGLLWQHLSLQPSLERAAAIGSVASMYAIWIALGLAAVLGTGGSTPIAGAGYQGGAFQEALVSGLLSLGSVAVLAAVLLVLWGLRAPRP
jgi:hydroxylaminobenzene mutase